MKAKAMLASLALACLLAGVLALTVLAPALAQTSDSFDLTWHVMGGGGQPAASARYVVKSVAGQGASSPPYSVSTSFAVSGGYWVEAPFRVYLPLVLREGG